MKSDHTKKKKKRKRSPENGADWSFDHLPGTLGPLFCLNAWTALTHSMSYVLFSHSAATRTCETLPFFFLRKAAAAQPAPVSRHIPFPGDSGGGERLKCTTLPVSVFMPGPESSRRVSCLSQSGWKTTAWRCFPGEGNGAGVQWRRVWGLSRARGGGVQVGGHWATGGSTDRLSAFTCTVKLTLTQLHQNI